MATLQEAASKALELLDRQWKCDQLWSMDESQEVTEELRTALALATSKDAERYRFLRDNFATKSEHSVDDFIALEPMTGDYFDAHIDILMSEFNSK